MPRRIHVLPDGVANQIAAGEVVERPASVVKELVENALDAGASWVRVEIKGGGKQEIRVADDGVGMSREDALLCLDRHATSKIATAEELARVRTLGFRGEALPSVAAVSRLSLQTRESEEDVGTALRANGGRIVGVEDTARQPGTTVEVRNLFFNAPARRKFLKAASAETRAVNETVTALALAHPRVSFSLLSGSNRLLDLPSAGDVATRVAGLWGEEEARKLLPVAGREGPVELRGLIQRPDAAEPGFRRAYLFVNRRPFRAPALLRAADRGYRTTVAPSVRPWLFLYFRVEDESVDVNVHPAKTEVRFRNQAAVETLLEESVQRALAGADSGATLDVQLAPPRLAVRETTAGRGGAGGADRETSGEGEPNEAPAQMALFLAGAPGREGEGTKETDDGAEGAGTLEAEEREILQGVSEESRPRLWQIHDTYILAETREGLLIIDQHAAHERVLFQRLMEAFEGGGEESQRLLFPLTLRLGRAEVRQIRELRGLLARAGFDVEEFGGDTVILHSVPTPHPYFEAERCFREMVAELAEGSELVRSARNQHERIAMTFACKGAVKAGQRLDLREMEELFDALFATELPFHDVHGRPTIVRLSKRELERKFGRSS